MADPRYLFQPVLYQAITPIHVGSGQDVGVVDLPVIRERTTDHPFLPGSGIRGALRARSESSDPLLTRRIFGSDDAGEISSGCVSILDAHLLLFPVRSAPGLFRWITCPFLLARHRKLHRDLCGDEAALPAAQASPTEGEYFGGGAGTLYLEEYPFTKGAGGWSWTLTLDGVDVQRVVLLSDADFLHFARTATLVRQRNRLSTAKTVLQGHLFSVESVPAETWFLGFVGATRERVASERVEGEPSEQRGQEPPPPMAKETVAEKLRLLAAGSEAAEESHLTLGGDESVGLGITRLRWGLAATSAGAER